MAFRGFAKFLCDFKSIRRGRPYFKSIIIRSSVDFALERNREVRRVAARLAPDLRQTSSVLDGMSEGGLQRLRDKPKRIQKIALSRSVGANQKIKRLKLDLAGFNAFVIGDVALVQEHRPSSAEAWAARPLPARAGRQVKLYHTRPQGENLRRGRGASWSW